MASCGGGGGGGSCQSQCLRTDEEAEVVAEEIQNRVGRLSIAAPGTGNSTNGDGSRAMCSKCGTEEQACNSLCLACFRFHLFGKFKLAVTSNAMISPTDKLLIAFSGGPASRVALQFVHEMQCKALKNWDASSKSSALPVFGVGVAFIDESVLSVGPSPEIDSAIEEIRLIVSDLAPPRKEFHIMPIESICSLDSKNAVSQLNQLLGTITDSTGKEDFLLYLRMLSLKKIASENKYNKLVLGSSTSSIARRVISATVKGQGYSLPADVQYVDARWGVPVVFPLRDFLEQELSMLCHLDSLKTQQLLSRPCNGINGLVSSFVSRLLDENPARERTIVRTAEKLKPFSFNRLVEDGCQDFVPSRLRRKFQNVKNIESTQPEVLCAICGSPLSELDLQSMKRIQGKSQTRVEIFAACCCQSCCFQILPKEPMSLEHFYTVLPQSMAEKVKDDMLADRSWLRDQIKDCLLSDDDDYGT